MKIYRKVTIDIASGATLEENSYEYTGPVAECKGNNAAAGQRDTAFDKIGQVSQANMTFANSMTDMLKQRYGAQTETFNILSGQMQNVLGRGTGMDFMKNQYDNQRGLGYGQGADGSGGAGGGGRGGEGGGGGDPFGNLNMNPGFLESDYKLNMPARGYMQMERVMRSQASEEVANDYRNALQTTNERMLQSGLTGGAAAQLVAQNQNAQAADEAAAAREVMLKVAGERATDSRLKGQLNAQLGIAKGDTRLKSAAMMNEAQMQIAKARQAAAMQRAAISAQSRSASAAQRAADARFRWGQTMDVAGMQNSNYWNAVKAMGGLAGMQDPLGYGQLTGGALGQAGSMWGNAYGNGQQAAQKPGFNWGALVGTIGGVAATIATGGAAAPLLVSQAGSLASSLSR